MKYLYHPCRFDWEPFDGYTCGFYRNLNDMPYVCGRCHAPTNMNMGLFYDKYEPITEKKTESLSLNKYDQDSLEISASGQNPYDQDSFEISASGQNPYDQDMPVETNNISAVSLSLNYNKYLPKQPSDFNTVDISYMPKESIPSDTTNFSLINNEYRFALHPTIYCPSGWVPNYDTSKNDTINSSLKRQNKDLMEETVSKKFKLNNSPIILNNIMDVQPTNKRKKNNYSIFCSKKMKHG